MAGCLNAQNHLLNKNDKPLCGQKGYVWPIDVFSEMIKDDVACKLCMKLLSEEQNGKGKIMSKTRSFRIDEKTKNRFDRVFYTEKSVGSKLNQNEFFNLLLDLYEQKQQKQREVKGENN